jgi:MGT family glycosyltransferase
MKRIGLLCPPAIGHLNPMCNLGYELQKRGYRVTLFGWPEVKKKVEAFQLGFYEIGAQEFPEGSLDELSYQLSKRSGMQAFGFTIRWAELATKMMFREVPDAIRKADIEYLLIDQITVAGGTIAEHLKLPFVTICNMPLDQEPGIPPYFTSWEYKNTPWAKLRNRLGYILFNYLSRSVWQVIEHQRQQWDLHPYKCLSDANSPLAQICQLPQKLDFTRERLPDNFFYVGTFHNFSKTSCVHYINDAFPFEKLNNKPLIYASLGTLQNRLFNIFYAIAKACQHLDAQLVISLGGGADPNDLPALPGAPLVVKFAPQLELLKRTQLTITHAGINTVLESLTHGVPMVAIPIANDQPGVAARIAHAGVGEVVTLSRLSAMSLKAEVDRVFHGQYYRDNASELASEIQSAGGSRYAVDIIERVMTRDGLGNSPLL